MNKPAGTSQAALLLAGFLVLAMPLAFFNNLLTAANERTRESAMGLLREEILQTAEYVRAQLKPASYVKNAVKLIHERLLPEVKPELIKMIPAAGFGTEQFSSDLPARFVGELRKEGLDAIQFIAFAPEYTNAYYWHCDELKRQCQSEDQLVYERTISHYYAAGRLYNQRYQKLWHRAYNLPKYLNNAFQFDLSTFSFAYLSRYGEMTSPHDRINEYFTDYFGRQSFYSYTYQCISPVTLHGGYSVLVPQNSVKPAAVVKAALKHRFKGIEAQMIELNQIKEGFQERNDRLEYYTRPPSDFWSHYLFITGDRSQAQKSLRGGWHVKISGQLPQTFIDQLQYFRIFRMLATLALMLYLAFAMRIMLFGFSSGGSVRSKLTVILGLIVLLPISGSGTMTWLALKSSDRIIENHLLHQTLNSIRETSVMNDENLLRQMVAVLEIKRRLENGTKFDPDLKQALHVADDNLSWFSTWTNSLNLTFESGEQFQYDTWGQTVPANRLVNSLVGKYTDSLGLFKVDARKAKSDLSRTMTLGLMENYITPELEEVYMVDESTITREVSHSSDTSRAAIFIIRNRSGQYQVLFQRINNNDEHVYRYLTWARDTFPKWFLRQGRYGDINLAVRLRKYLDLYMFAWPSEALLDEAANENFERALSTKDMGYGITRKDNELEIRAWRLKDGETAIISSICRSRGNGLAGLATFMTVPLLCGYAVLVLYFVTAIIAVFIKEPVKIINSGVEYLKNENYGVLIASFSGDEFKNMTQAFNEMSNALRQREMMKRYVSGKLMQQMQADQQLTPRAAGQLIRITALASDIRGFTSVCEKYSPAEIVEMLNSYFTLMEAAIISHGGIIDKYVGDAVQALFYHDNNLENAAIRACRAAKDMRRQLKDFNLERSSQGLFTIENGIGIATGMAVSGSIGGEQGRKDFTVVGSVIELAASIEAKTTGTDSKILLCLETGKEVAQISTLCSFDATTMELQDV